MEISSANEPIVKVEREELLPDDKITLNLNIVPKASEAFTHTSSTAVSFQIKNILKTWNIKTMNKQQCLNFI